MISNLVPASLGTGYKGSLQLKLLPNVQVSDTTGDAIYATACFITFIFAFLQRWTNQTL